MNQQPLAGKVALVTGASRGIGYAAARGFARAGAHIIAVARTVGALEELDDAITAEGGSATLVPLDITDGAGIDNLGGAIAQRWGKLDVLLANAGILGPLTPLAHLSEKDFDALIAANLKPNWRLLRSMDALLRSAQDARCLFMTSSVGRTPRPFWGGYALTKAALEMIARTYAEEVRQTGVRVTIIDPGATRSQMRASAFPGEDPDSLKDPEDLVPLLIHAATTPDLETGQTVRYRDWQQT